MPKTRAELLKLRESASFEKFDRKALVKNIQSSEDFQNGLMETIDALCTNPVWAEEFQAELKKQFAGNAQAHSRIDKLTFYTEEQLELAESFQIQTVNNTSPNIGNLIQTNVMPIVDGLIKDDQSLLSEVQMRNVDSPSTYVRVNEFDAETDAEMLSEIATGTTANDGNRLVDTLTPKKVQASISMSELTVLSLDPATYAQYLAKGVRRVSNRIVQQILNGDDTGNNLRGIIPTTGAGQARMGALTVADPAGSPDNLDRVVEMLVQLPDFMSGQEEAGVKFAMPRSALFSLLKIVSPNSYKFAGGNFGPITRVGNSYQIMGHDVLITNAGLKNTTTTANIVLGHFKNYVLAMLRGVTIKSDEGKVQLREGINNFVFNAYVDGTPTLAFQYTADGAGATASTANTPNNQARNFWRVKNITL
jgi:HK97 family phage major capsid protein